MTSPSKLGKYAIRRELGKGAMGVVYEGHDPMIDRIVALKTIRAENLQGEDAQEQLARFRREAQAAGRLTHPNIVGIYDFGEDAGTYYIAMEFVKGRELQSYLEANERFALHDIVRVMGQLLEALQYSHKHGVVHRDIKPSNILVTLHDAEPVSKVIDFGIAKATEGRLTDATVYTQLHQFIGTPAYMSPEQAEMSGLDIDTRSAIYSLGVLLYGLLAVQLHRSGLVLTSEPAVDAPRFNQAS